MSSKLPETVLSRLECTQSKVERNFHETKSDYEFVKSELESQYERLPDVAELLKATTEWGVTAQRVVLIKRTHKLKSVFLSKEHRN